MNAEGESKNQRGRLNQIVSPVLAGVLLFGIVLHLAGFFLFRLNSSGPKTITEPAPFLKYVSSDTFEGDLVLEEQSLLLDSAPLFLPTKWNLSQNLDFVNKHDLLVSRFPDYEPEIDILSQLKPEYSEIVTNVNVSEPIGLLASHYWRFWGGFGREGRPVESFPSYESVIEFLVIKDVMGGGDLGPVQTQVIRLPLPGDVQVNFPVGLSLRVSDVKKPTRPVVMSSSGNREFDDFAIRWLQQPEVLGRLPLGYLSVRVFPPFN